MNKSHLICGHQAPRQFSLFSLILAFALPSCAASNGAISGDYPAVNSGIIARGDGEREIYWLDNERVIFIGSKPGEKRIEDGRRFPKDDLYVWNTRTNEIVREAALSSRSGLCVAPGYIRYQFRRDGVTLVRYGAPGLTHESELDVQAYRDGILALSPVSCREFNPKLLRKRYGNWALPLLEAGEYLDRTSPHTPAVLRYFPADGSEAIPLPAIPNRDVNPIPRYSRYLDRYIFSELRRHIAASVPQRVWLLDRKGHVEKFEIPAGPWMAATVTQMPTKAGWIVASRARGLRAGLGAAGLYVVRDSTVVRIATVYPYGIAVSPDGCSLATAIELRSSGSARPTVWKVGLCSKGK